MRYYSTSIPTYDMQQYQYGLVSQARTMTIKAPALALIKTSVFYFHFCNFTIFFQTIHTYTLLSNKNLTKYF